MDFIHQERIRLYRDAVLSRFGCKTCYVEPQLHLWRALEWPGLADLERWYDLPFGLRLLYARPGLHHRFAKRGELRASGEGAYDSEQAGAD